MEKQRNKKVIQLAALSVLLVAVIIGGIWFLTHSKEPANTPDNSDNPAISQTNSGGPGASPIDLSREVIMEYRTIRQESERLVDWDSLQSEIIFYQGQACIYHTVVDEAADTVQPQILSLADGQVLKDYGVQPADQRFGNSAIDEKGDLWTLVFYVGPEENAFPWDIAYCGQEYVLGERKNIPLDEQISWGAQPFAVRDGRLYLHTFDESGGYLDIFDLETMERLDSLPIVQFYCFDGDGILYYYEQLGELGEVPLSLVAYSPEEGRELYRITMTDGKPFFTNGRLAGLEKGCLLRSGDMEPIYRLDPETQTVSEFLLPMQDLDEPADFMRQSDACFAMDAGSNLFFLNFEEHYAPDDWYAQRTAAAFSPVRREIDMEKAAVIILTSPYVVESVDKSIQRFQRKYPEITVQWDTQYPSREEFQKDSLTYKDQIAVRTITGDIGDVVLVSGSGLDQDIVTGTDAYADLTAYLDACPFKEQLSFAPLEGLRGEDGAVRAVPIALNPKYYLWNTDQMERFGFELEHVTWLELLRQAKQWKEEGADFSLAAADERSFGENNLLRDLLLANLYDAEKPDGTVQLDQPYLRELLELWKELQGTDYLVRADGNLDKALLRVPRPNEGVAGDVDDLLEWKTRASRGTKIAPPPKGEVWKRPQGYAFCWAISNRSEHKDAAWTFLQYLISAEGVDSHEYLQGTLLWNRAGQDRYRQDRWYYWSGYAESQVEQVFQELRDVMEQPFSCLSEKYGWSDAVYAPVRQYLDGGLTLDDAMTQANTNWARMLLE